MKYNEIVNQVEDTFPELEKDIKQDYTDYKLSINDRVIFFIRIPDEQYYINSEFEGKYIEEHFLDHKGCYYKGEGFINYIERFLSFYRQLFKLKKYGEDGKLQEDINKLFQLGFKENGSNYTSLRENWSGQGLNFLLSGNDVDISIWLPGIIDDVDKFYSTFRLRISSNNTNKKIRKYFSSLEKLIDYLTRETRNDQRRIYRGIKEIITALFKIRSL